MSGLETSLNPDYPALLRYSESIRIGETERASSAIRQLRGIEAYVARNLWIPSSRLGHIRLRLTLEMNRQLQRPVRSECRPRTKAGRGAAKARHLRARDKILNRAPRFL